MVELPQLPALGDSNGSTRMTLLELVESKRDEIARMGELAIARAKRAGVPAVYMDPSLGPGLIREMPDGTRERFERRDGDVVILETLAPTTRHAG